VAPSIPGFGFSPAPTSTGYNFRAAAASFNALMIQLNYTKYVVQGGDLGAYISHFIAGDFPDNVVSVHSNFWLVSPNATDVARLLNGTATEDEVTTITNLQNFEHNLSGFTHVHSIMPLQVALPLSDSPVGYALWVYVLMHYGSDNYNWSAEEIITWSLMHYIQVPFGAIRFYKEGYLVSGSVCLSNCSC
jgi:pimeloyl-ACP methyl ester carboxylesterase